MISISESKKAFLNFYKEETKQILKLSAPIFFSYLAWFGMSSVDAIFLVFPLTERHPYYFQGHLGDNELSSASLGNMWIWCTGFLAFGITFGMDTLVSQAYGAGFHFKIRFSTFPKETIDS